MTEYQLQILRNMDVLPNYDTAIAVLNSYKYHRVGQPVALLYKQGNEVRVIFAIGKKDCDSVQPGEPDCGSTFYDIINRNSQGGTVTMKWRVLGQSIDQNVSHAIYEGKHSELTITDADDYGEGTLLYCMDGVIARVKRLPESADDTVDDIYEFYGRMPEEDPIKIRWEDIDNADQTEPIRFKTGTQEQYDNTTKENGNIYTTTDTNRLYKGDVLLGDSYVSEESEDSVVATSIGGIKAGSSLKSIIESSKGSVSKILDMIFFPAYAPQYSHPTCTISTPSNNSCKYIYDYLPAMVYNATQAKTYANKNVITGGEAGILNAEIKLGDESYSADSPLQAQKVGQYVYKLSTFFEKGTDAIVDTKGKNAFGWASNAETLADSPQLNTNYLEFVEDGGYYVVGGRTGILANDRTITVVYPVWIQQPGQNAIVQSAVDCNLLQNGGKEGIQLNASIGSNSIGGPTSDNSWTIYVPEGKSLKVILRALDGTYPEANAQQLTYRGTTDMGWTSVDGDGQRKYITTDIYVYNGPSYSGGLHKIIIS
jgi:hypothetical protein